MIPVSDDRNRKQRACRARLAVSVAKSLPVSSFEARFRSGRMTDDQASRYSLVEAALMLIALRGSRR